jgi:hypothetical protein
MTDRKKPGMAFWATVVVVVALLAYLLSFGPACWLSAKRPGDRTRPHSAMMVYLPLGAIANSETWAGEIVRRWMLLKVPDGYSASVPYRRDGRWLNAYSP